MTRHGVLSQEPPDLRVVVAGAEVVEAAGRRAIVLDVPLHRANVNRAPEVGIAAGAVAGAKLHPYLYRARRQPLVLVMQATQHRASNELARSRRASPSGRARGSLEIQCAMRPPPL